MIYYMIWVLNSVTTLYTEKAQPKQKTGRPRPIFVSFSYLRLKHMVLPNAYKVKDVPERKHLPIRRYQCWNNSELMVPATHTTI